MVLLAEPSKTNDKSETDVAHEKSVAKLHARLDAEQKLKEKVREEERACFEGTARILGHKPPSAEQVKAGAHRHEMIARIAKLGEKAGFIGEAFRDDHGKISGGHFPGSQIMGGDWLEDKRPYDIGSNPPFSSYHYKDFGPPYRFKREYLYPPTDGGGSRGADRLTGKVFAKCASLDPIDSRRIFAASVGVTFSLPASRFDGILRVSPPPFRTSQARIFASIAGTKRWFFHAENYGGECFGEVSFYPIFKRPIYDDQFPDSTGQKSTDSAMQWRKLTTWPYQTDYDWNRDWPAPTALPTTAISPWFTVDNYHTYDIHVGVVVATQGSWRIGDDAYSLAVAEIEAVIESITVEFTG